MKTNELIKILTSNGWYEVSQEGGHKKFRHPEKTNFVIVPYHKGKDVPKKLTKKILKQAGIE